MAKNSIFEAKYAASQCSYGHKFGTGGKVLPRRSDGMSFNEIVWTVFEKSGHEFGMLGCPIVIRRYMSNFIEILRAVFEKFEVFQKVGIGKNKRTHRSNSTSK